VETRLTVAATVQPTSN